MSSLFFKRSPQLGYAAIFNNVSDVLGPTNWIGDWAATRDVLQQFEADPSLIELDEKQFAENNARFIYNWMCYFKYRRDHFPTYPSKAFNIGFSFDLTISFRDPKEFSLLYMPPENIYKTGAIYKRFHQDCGAVIFENGECYITGRCETQIFWIAGIMNHILTQVRPRQTSQHLTNWENLSVGTKLDETWDIFKSEKIDSPVSGKHQRVQPERAAKRRNTLLPEENVKRKMCCPSDK
jgi:hypothetical protein